MDKLPEEDQQNPEVVVGKVNELKQELMTTLLKTVIENPECLTGELFDFINIGHRKASAEIIGRAVRAKLANEQKVKEDNL
jgi:hypothetical protein